MQLDVTHDVRHSQKTPTKIANTKKPIVDVPDSETPILPTEHRER
jgi:hypothetical protein